MAVRPQRKFAMKPPDLQDNAVIDDPPEPERTVPAVPYISTVSEPVSHLIDEMAFKNIHNHPKRVSNIPTRNQKEVRIVLKRISPPRSEPQNLQTMVLRNRSITKGKSKSSNVRKVMKVKRLQAPRRVSETSTEDTPLTYLVRKKKLRSKKNNKSILLENKEESNKTNKKNTRSHTREKDSNEQSAMASRVCVGDSSKLKRKLPNDDDVIVIDDDFENKVIHSTSVDVVSVSLNSDTGQIEDIAERSSQTSKPTLDAWAIFLHRIFDWTPDSENVNVGDVSEQMKANSVVISEHGAVPVMVEHLKEESMENIENGGVSVVVEHLKDESIENIEHNKDDCSNLSRERVQEWLRSQTGEANQTTQTEFKVPEPPRRRVNERSLRPSLSSVGSTKIPLPVIISCKENLLRQNCTAWKSNHLNLIDKKPDIIQSFCMECTRCEAMFDMDKLQKLSRSLPSGSFVDVYEFNSEQDDDLDLQPFRTRRLDDQSLTIVQRKQILFNISKQPNHKRKLKEVMTEKGREILKAAVLLVNGVKPPSPTNLSFTKVIGVLMECNAARIDYEKRSAEASDASASVVVPPANRLMEPETTASTQRSSFDDSDIMPLAGKRLRNNNYEAQLQQQKSEGALVKAPTFDLTIKEFAQCPVTFAYKVQQKIDGVSLCGIKPPDSFKPGCVVNNPHTNFNARNHYIQRMMKRWGVGTRELVAIRSIQDPKIQRSPLFEGIELDLVKLYHTVQEERGLEACQKNVQKWEVVARKMKLHYTNNKAYSKLENIYLKYLLEYNSLTCLEREKTIEKVDMCWRAREAKAKVRVQVPLWRQEYMRSGRPLGDDEELSLYEKVCAEAEECVTSGRYCNLNTFKKMANQVMKTYFPKTQNPDPKEVEVEYWGIVTSANAHVCVHAGSVEANDHDVGFTRDLSDAYGKHPWNLKRLSVSPKNLLSYLGPTLGVSSTTVHYGMLFSTSCWHMDPTSVPWIEYLHTGSPKIWYSVGASQAVKMRAAMEKVCPFAVQNKPIWLPCDFAMIPPKSLRQYGVTVQRHVQRAGEYVIVYPNTYTACIDTGFNISEGVYFAPHEWIKSIDVIFQKLRVNAEPSLFSMEDLLMSIVQHKNVPYTLLQQASTQLVPLLHAELDYRTQFVNSNMELITPEVFLEQNRRASRTSWQIQKGGECAYCRCHLHLSKVVGVTEGQTSVCARHGALLIDALKRKRLVKNAYCIVLISNTQINMILDCLRKRLAKDAV